MIRMFEQSLILVSLLVLILKDMPFDGERHNALADAIHQAKYVSAIFSRLVKGQGES